MCIHICVLSFTYLLPTLATQGKLHRELLMVLHGSSMSVMFFCKWVLKIRGTKHLCWEKCPNRKSSRTVIGQTSSSLF